MYTLFKASADKPPIFKNQPPVAGAISWERSLFLRIKHTILRFQEMEDMLNSEQGRLVRMKLVLSRSHEVTIKSFILNDCSNKHTKIMAKYCFSIQSSSKLNSTKQG